MHVLAQGVKTGNVEVTSDGQAIVKPPNPQCPMWTSKKQQQTGKVICLLTLLFFPTSLFSASNSPPPECCCTGKLQEADTKSN